MGADLDIGPANRKIFNENQFEENISFEFSPQLWWVSAMIGASMKILLAGRFLAGFGAGGVFVLVPMYVAEISESRTRGILGSFFIFSINFGTLVMFVAGNYLSYSLVPRVMIAFPIAFAVTFAFLPETPEYLLRCGKTAQAEKSLIFLRGCGSFKEVPAQIRNELLEMSKKIDEDSDVKGDSLLKDLGRKYRHDEIGFHGWLGSVP